MAKYVSTTTSDQINDAANDITFSCLSIASKSNECSEEIGIILDKLDFICVHAQKWASMR